MRVFKKYIYVIIAIVFLNVNCHAFVLDEYKRPTPLFLKLCKLLDIKDDASVKEINDFMQKTFYRESGQARENLPETSYESKKEQFFPIFKEMGLIDQILPKNKNYDYIIVHGGSIRTIRERLGFLLKILDLGITTKQIIIFSGERFLDPENESKEIICKTEDENNFFKTRIGWKCPEKLPFTEKEGTEMVIDQLISDEDLKAKINIINTSSNISQNGKVYRSPTRTTIDEWFINYKPQKGNILAISNNPYIPYQDIVMRQILSKYDWFKQGGTLETVGPHSLNTVSLAQHLNNISEILLTELQ